MLTNRLLYGSSLAYEGHLDGRGFALGSSRLMVLDVTW
jgi:hypothetical protein